MVVEFRFNGRELLLELRELGVRPALAELGVGQLRPGHLQLVTQPAF